MAILLPPLPAFSNVDISLSTNAWNLVSSFGGPDQRIARMGDRWTAAVTCQGMSQPQAGPVLALVTEGLHQKLVMVLPQVGVSPPSNGTVVSGSGKTLLVSGTSPQPGQFFSISHAGVHYLHRVVAVAGSTLTIQPSLKVVLTSGDLVDFKTPKIEGFIAENSVSHSFGLSGVVNLSFSIREAQ